MKKVCFVVQRYGIEVNGGAELHCRQYAERLVEKYNVEVLTTCAVDYVTWRNEYSKGTDIINGVTVRRFPVVNERNQKEFDKISQKAFSSNSTRNIQLKWMEEQGPFSIGLIEYIRNNQSKYDVFFFMTYLYYSTFHGIQQVPDKSILIPTAHDEPPIYLSIFQEIFPLPKAIFFNTVEEKTFVDNLFNTANIASDIGGVGVDIPDCINGKQIIEKFKLEQPYIVYVGRIDESKGCGKLFEYFMKYKKETSNNLKLVLVGKTVMEIPNEESIISLGFVSDEDKFAIIQESELLVLPSQYESLSMVVLEALSLSKPILVNGMCEVLKGHCIKGNCGLYYTDYEEFRESLTYMIDNHNISSKMGKLGKDYQQKNYDWAVILEKLDRLIASVS